MKQLLPRSVLAGGMGLVLAPGMLAHNLFFRIVFHDCFV